MRKVVLALLLSALALLPASGQQKRRVAVMDFGYGTVMTSVQAIFGTNQDIGKGITDMLVNQLLADAKYHVYERAVIDKVINEQNFSNSNRADPATAARIGALAGVDVIIVGDITTFGRDDKNYGGGAVGYGLGKFGMGGLGVHKAKAVVEITARMVDVNTGEILASVTGRGESKRSGTDMLGGGGSGWNGGGGHLDMGSANFGQTIIGEATKESVAQVATNLDQKADVLPAAAAPPAAPIDGLVADASTDDIIINVGSGAGVKVGDTLAVTRVLRTVKDPATGRVLRTIDQPVGTLTITSVDSGSAVGRFSGASKPQTGDHVKRP